MSTTTTNTTCACGAPATEESIELAEFLPRVYQPECGACTAKREFAEKADAARAEEAREAAVIVERMEAIPPEMRRTDINHRGFNPGLWIRVEGWDPRRLRWLGLVGSAGEAKTRCLALLAKRLIHEGHRVAWTTAVDFQDRVDSLTRGDRGEVKEAHQYFRDCKTATILVLDDIGKNTWTPSIERHLFSVIDYRKTHDLPVLWTANTSPVEILASGQLTKDRGAPLMGRLIEASKIEKA